MTLRLRTVMRPWEIQAIEAGRKSQFRKPVRPQPTKEFAKISWRFPGEDLSCIQLLEVDLYNQGLTMDVRPPYKPGQVLEVRLQYRREDLEDSKFSPIFKTPLRIRVRPLYLERLQDIRPEDAIAEGVERLIAQGGPLLLREEPAWDNGMHYYKNYKDPRKVFNNPVSSFASLCPSLYGPEAWEQNWLMWVYALERI
jgi:hypothetical protein